MKTKLGVYNAYVMIELRKKPLRLVIFAVFAGVIGSTWLLISSAASLSTSIEVEAGNLVGVANVISSKLASRGAAIRFGKDTNSESIWKPQLNSPWMWVLGHPLDINRASDMGTGAKAYDGANAPDPAVYDIDGEDNSKATVAALHDRGAKVICYFSAGTSEN